MPGKWLLVRNQDQVILTNNFRNTRVGHLFWNPPNDGSLTDWLYTGVQIQSEILSSLNYEVCTRHFKNYEMGKGLSRTGTGTCNTSFLVEPNVRPNSIFEVMENSSGIWIYLHMYIRI